MPDANPVEKLCLQARRAIAKRDWTKAKLAYLQALGLKSDLPDVHYGLATIYFQLRELTSAAHHFREATRLDPARAGAFINLGAVLNVLGEYDDAIKVLRQGLLVDPSRAEGYYNLGLVYRRKEQLDLAVTAYREALRLNPRMADAHLNLANVFLDRENLEQARDHYKSALEVRPGWEKAEAGLEEVEERLSPTPSTTSTEEVPSVSDRMGRAQKDPDRMVNPDRHGTYLKALHKAAIESEDAGRELIRILEKEMEPVIKELSTCLLYRNRSRTELNDCVQRFEEAMEHIRKAHQTIQERVNRTDRIGQEFPD